MGGNPDDAGLTVRSPESLPKASVSSAKGPWGSRVCWLAFFVGVAIIFALGFGLTARTAAPSAPSDEFEAAAINITVVLEIL